MIEFIPAFRFRLFVLFMAASVSLGGCSGDTGQTEVSELEPAPEPTEPTESSDSESQAVREPEPPESAPPDAPDARCESPIPIYEAGETTGSVCPEQAEVQGLTVLALSDSWAPMLFSEDPSLGEVGHQPYREVYLALADERLSDVPDSLDKEQFLELFGITPTFRVLIERLSEDSRHACHAAIDTSAVAGLAYALRPWAPSREEQRERVRSVDYLRHRLERAVGELELENLAALEGHELWGLHYARYLRLSGVVDAILAVQAHLRCDGLGVGPGQMERGVFDGRTSRYLARFQRHHLIVSGGLLDEPTRNAMTANSREQDFAAVLRALRERVVSATGLIEDGSAGRNWRDVMGVPLDAAEFRFEAGQPAALNPAPDLISPATAVAARALGLTDANEALVHLRQLRERGHSEVAVELPSLPSYHSAHMDLRAELDRGDVYYGYPYDENGRRRPQRVERRPVLTLYARDGDREVALVRWPSTIGGWKPERHGSGGNGLKYKQSYVGERVWRDVIAAPAWLPPPSTPEEDLVQRVRGRWVPKYGLFGPGYRSAYGLAMLMHHRVLEPRDPDAEPGTPDAEPRFYDQGIRTHGSVSYRSMTRGTSHGCHRLFNHLAVRLASFVLTHRTFVRHGSISVRFRRQVRGTGFRIPSRGYRYELTPPVPIEVLEGEIHGRVRSPIRGFRRLREDLLRRFETDSAE